MTERVEVDDVLRCIDIEAFNKFRFRHMRRKESRIYTLEREVLASKRWAKMKDRVDLGTTTRDDPHLRIPRIIKRSTTYAARAAEFLEVRDYMMTGSRKALKRLIAHEMIHYYLIDNGAYTGTRKKECYENRAHGRLFNECAAVVLDASYAKPVYRYKCSCGWWVKTERRVLSYLCEHCGKTMLRKSEHERLRKVAAIGSKVRPVDLNRYTVMTVDKVGH